MIKKFLNIFFLILIFLASSYALFHRSFFHIHDFTHAARIAEMSRALVDGQLPVRWSENFGFGFGMPLFNFYAPLPYFVGALFSQLGFSAVASLKLLYFLSNLLTIWGAYLLGKRLFGRAGALLLTAAYTLAPYRAVNLFVRGALSEAWAMAFLPFALWGVISFVQTKQRKYLLVLLLSLVAIVLSHNLTALMFIPLSALFVFLYLLREKQIKLLWQFILIYFLAFALTAFYILPALFEKNLTMIEQIFSGYFHYSNHFLYIRQFFQNNWQYGGSAWGPDDGISFFLGQGQLLGLLGLAYLSIKVLWQKAKIFTQSKAFFFLAFFSLASILALFLSLQRSLPIWEQLKFLQYIQFPWRFLTVATFFIALLIGASSYLIRNNYYRYTYSFLLLIVLFFNLTFFRPKEYLDDANSLYYEDASRISSEMSEILPDYIPAQMPSLKLLKNQASALPKFWLDDQKNNDKLELMFANSFRQMLAVELKEESLVNFKVAYFPGWQAEVDGEVREIIVNQSLGNIQVLVPAGSHKVAIFFSENTLARKMGDGLSILALIVTLYFFSPFAKVKDKLAN